VKYFICFGLLLLITSESCRPLPKVTTFVAASSELRKGVNSGFTAVQRSLLSDDLLTNRELNRDAKQLKALFAIVDKTLLGTTAYAGALSNLVESGNSGEANAGQVADALTKIVDQVAPAPATALVGLTGEAVKRLYGQIARVRAAKDLKTIMDEANPTVDSLRVVFAKMTAQLIRYNRAVYLNKRQALLDSSALSKHIIDYETYLDKEQTAIFAKLALISQYKAGVSRPDAFARLKDMDALITTEAAIEPRQPELVEQSKRVEQEKARILPVTDRVRAARKRYADEFANIDQLFRKSGEALDSWADTHADIRKQLDQKKRPNFEELVGLIDDIKEIREKIKSLNL
jgi:hypothetical protein